MKFWSKYVETGEFTEYTKLVSTKQNRNLI